MLRALHCRNREGVDMEKKPRKKQPDASVAYRGRSPARAGSEQRRRAILEAALRIIIRDGVRAVRHRAVAAEAGVPLSATTYYFKDIHDLIADAFSLFVENGLAQVIDPAWLRIYQFVGQFDLKQLKDPQQRKAFVGELARHSADFIERELREQREHLLAEQAFLQAAILDERLRVPASAFRNRVVEGLTGFCQLMGTVDPALDAELIHQTFLRLEYEHLIREDEGFDRARVEQVMSHLFTRVISG